MGDIAEQVSSIRYNLRTHYLSGILEPQVTSRVQPYLQQALFPIVDPALSRNATDPDDRRT